ncbi:hypothetical protein ALISP_5621 [Alicycliphilus sp. B1]|nr:hypothetical protein ALISP_5621 [Alicycliphilus sp. B1]
MLPPGLPSYSTQVVPPSRPPTWAFHMIQPVELYQWKRSPKELGRVAAADVVVQHGQLQHHQQHAAMDRARWASAFPWCRWKYTIHSGWSKGSHSGSKAAVSASFLAVMLA